MASYVYTACRRVGKGMGDTAAVSDYVQAVVGALQVLVHCHFHVVEFDFDAVQKGVFVRRTGRNLIQRINHFDNAVQDTFRQNQTQIPGRCV